MNITLFCSDVHYTIFTVWEGRVRLWGGGHVMDTNEPQVNDSWYIEGTIYLVGGWVGAGGMVFRAWAHGRRHGGRNGWYSRGAVGPVRCDCLKPWGDLLESSGVGQLINFKSKKKPLQGRTRACGPPGIWPGATLGGPAQRGQLRGII